MVWDLAISPLPIMATPSSGTGEVTCCRVIHNSRSWAHSGAGGGVGRAPSDFSTSLPCGGHCVRLTIHCSDVSNKQPAGGPRSRGHKPLTDDWKVRDV